MPYKDKTKQLAFQNAWMKKRRTEFFADKVCACNATENLMLVRKNAGDAKGDAHFWSMKEKKRALALTRYFVSCRSCAKEILHNRWRIAHTGKRGDAFAFNHSDVWAIRGRLMGQETVRTIARDFGVTHQVIQSIQQGRTWGWLKRKQTRKIFGIDYHERREWKQHKTRGSSRRKTTAPEKFDSLTGPM